MESKNLVICDRETDYASAFANYLMRRDDLSLQIQCYSDLSYVLAMQKKEKIDFLFISSEYPQKAREGVEADHIFVLAEERKVETSNRETLIYKYRPGDEILVEMIRQYNESGEGHQTFLHTKGKEMCQVITVFSPVHRIGKTTYALKLGQKLSRDKNVLYINMQTYGGEHGETESLSDLLYYARQEHSDLGMILTTLIRRVEGLDCITSVRVSEDVKSLSGEEWAALIGRVMEESIYDTLILDLDEGVRDLYTILGISDEIHLLTLREEAAEMKIRQFEEELILLGYEDISKKIIRKEQHV